MASISSRLDERGWRLTRENTRLALIEAQSISPPKRSASIVERTDDGGTRSDFAHDSISRSQLVDREGVDVAVLDSERESSAVAGVGDGRRVPRPDRRLGIPSSRSRTNGVEEPDRETEIVSD